MATITHYLSKALQPDGSAQVYARVTAGRGRQWRLPMGVYVNPRRFESGAIKYPRANQCEIAMLREVERRLQLIDAAITDVLLSRPAATITKPMVEAAVRRAHQGGHAYGGGARGFFTLYDEFLDKRELSSSRLAMYRVLQGMLRRYESYREEMGITPARLDVDAVTTDDLEEFEQFLRDEHIIALRYPLLYADERRKPGLRGENTIINNMKKLRAFFNWLDSEGITPNRPFARYHSASPVYGTPFYLTIDERDSIAAHDFPGRPQLAVQRDVFVFQCLVGCRVGDLTRLTRSNVSNGWLEYVPDKTRRVNARTVRVPLSAAALSIIERYATTPGGPDTPLLPFISHQRYNDAIKEMCLLCGIDRVVTVINPTTGLDERHPIWEVASSHMGRRTFIGNMYKRVRDPNLVGSLTGHVEGSKAFLRYRHIDDDIKRDLIHLIE